MSSIKSTSKPRYSSSKKDQNSQKKKVCRPNRLKSQFKNVSQTFTQKPLKNSQKHSNNNISYSNYAFQQQPIATQNLDDLNFSSPNQQASILEKQYISQIPLSKQPTNKIFRKLKKRFNSKIYIKGQIIFAKCEGEPLWPAKIQQIETISGLLPEETVYHVKFINENNTTILNSLHMLKFNQETVEQVTQVTFDKKFLRAIKMAEKKLQEKDDSESQSESNKSFEMMKTYLESKIIQQEKQQQSEQPFDISSFNTIPKKKKQKDQVVEFQEIQESLKKGQLQKADKIIQQEWKKMGLNDHKSSKKQQKNPSKRKQKSMRKNQSLKSKIKTFEPMVLIKDNKMEISFEKGPNKAQSTKQQKINRTCQENQPVSLGQRAESPETQTKEHSKIGSISKKKKIKLVEYKKKSRDKKVLTDLTRNVASIPIEQEQLKPMNLIIETPRIPANFYLNKIVFNFGQDQPDSGSDIEQGPDKAKQTLSKQQTSSKANIYVKAREESSSKKQFAGNSKSISADNSKQKSDGKDFRDTNLVQKQMVVSQDFDLKVSKETNSSDIEKYLEQYLYDINRVTRILHKSQKQKNILNYLTRPLHIIVIQQNYQTYDNIIKLAIQVIQSSQKFNINDEFCRNLAQKLKLVNKRTHEYDGTNKHVRRLKGLCLKRLEDFLKSYEGQKQSDEDTSESENERDDEIELENAKEDNKTFEQRDMIEQDQLDLRQEKFEQKSSYKLNQKKYQKSQRRRSQRKRHDSRRIYI